MGSTGKMTVTAATVAALAACSLLGGGAGSDPAAGWGGTWTGAYYGVEGNSGSIELEIGADSMGMPLGVARFDTESGVSRARLLDLRLSADSLHARMLFDGLSAEIIGARREDTAEGSYVIRPAGSEAVFDSGSWQIARNRAASN
jgi:hypothetical protein